MNILQNTFGNNQEQIECSSWVEGPLMVLSGPGVGKTRVLTHRIGYLLRLHPNEVFRVLALTFTNKAAGEMKKRLLKIPGYVKTRVWTGTFHGFCTHLLRQYSCYVGIQRSFTIIDDQDQLGIIEDIKEMNPSLRAIDPRNIRDHISHAKSILKTPEEYSLLLESEHGSSIPAQCYAEYERRIRSSNLMDYDDLIWWTIKLIDSVPIIRKIIIDTFRFVLIDECQDTTYAQHMLISSLLPDKNPNVFAVADENQSIFEWNNARIRNLADMINQYGMEVKNLNRSYRCPPEVLRIANRILLNTSTPVRERKGGLVSEKSEMPGCVSIHINDSDEEEAIRVLEIIKVNLREGRDFSDIAVIGRTRFTFREIESVLSDENIPYVIVADSSLLRTPEVSLYLSAIRVLLNHDDAESLRQLIVQLNPGDGLIVSTAIKRFTEDDTSLKEIIKQLDKVSTQLDGVRRIQYLYNGLQCKEPAKTDVLSGLKLVAEVLNLYLTTEPSIGDREYSKENLELLWTLGQRFYRESDDRTLPAFVARLMLERHGDIFRDAEYDSNYVKLLTIHAAKGTEYPIVIIVAFEEGILPHYLSRNTEKLDEERRACYVAMTRTEEKLFLSYAKCRKDRNENYWTKEPSIFLVEAAEEMGLELY